ncbi:6-hydroxymethylpterin diphosphokinase MptE-like protein [Thermoplasma volcanium]|nr:6-hydroxymethylpterin diphosphokinase MptE-like protein [Thermoplasma volcanium]
MDIYRAICDDFNINPSSDYISAVILSSLSGEFKLPHRSNEINVVGNGPELKDILTTVTKRFAIVADSAISIYYEELGCPDIIVTDLDGDLSKIWNCKGQGTLIVVHAHGDNIKRIIANKEHIDRRVAGTTQNLPYRQIKNFYGFSDGDRAAYLADYLGAQKIFLIGFDFLKPSAKPGSNLLIKMKKLKWARYLIAELAKSRRSSFNEGEVSEI